MILNGLLFVMAGGAIIWLATSIWVVFGGRLTVAIVAAGAVSAAGAAASLVAIAGPRYSVFWNGSAGGGDGTGLIGYFLIGLSAFFLGFVMMLISWGLAAMHNPSAQSNDFKQ